MGAGAKIGASAIPVALAADGLKKDPFSAGQQPPKEPGLKPSGPTALEKALCKVRQEQECAKKKPKVSHCGAVCDGHGCLWVCGW